MPRDSNGIYSLPTGNPVVTGTVITSTWANNTCGDIGNELTDSLSRSGEGGMLAPLKLAPGTKVAPGLVWTSTLTAGVYLFGPNDIRFAMGGADVLRIASDIGIAGLSNIPGICIGDETGTDWIKIGLNYIVAESSVGPLLELQNVANAQVKIGDQPGGSYLTISNSGLDVHRQGPLTINTRSPAQGSLWIDNQATGTGLERVLTTSDIGVSNNFPGPNPTLANAVAAITIGSTDPNTDPHIAAGPDEIQAKANGTTAADLKLQPDGGNLEIYSNGALRVDFDNGGETNWIASHVNGYPNYMDFQSPTPGPSTAFGRFGFESSINLAIFAYNGGYLHLRSAGSPDPVSGANVEYNIALSNGTGLNMPGIRTALLRLGSTWADQPATLTSTNHFLQVGNNATNLRISSQHLCTSVAGGAGVLRIQNTANGESTMGDTSNNGAYFYAAGTTNAQIIHKGSTIAQSALPAAGGLLVNGLYGLQRVLTLSDLNPPTKYMTSDVTVTNTTTPANVPALTFTLAAASTYLLSGYFNMYWEGTGPIYIEVAEGAIADTMLGVWMPPPVASGAYTYNFSGGLIGARINIIVSAQLNGFDLTFEGTLTTSAASSVTVNICTPTASLDPFSVRAGSRLTCQKIS